MKWKRAEPGKYVSGDWVVEGKGTKWRLLCAGEEVSPGHSKKELQQAAEEAEREEQATKKKPPKQPPGKKVKIKKDPTTDDIPDIVEHEKGTVSLDSALRSIRLTLDSLAYSNNMLATTMRELADSNEDMSKAVRQLLKFMESKK